MNTFKCLFKQVSVLIVLGFIFSKGAQAQWRYITDGQDTVLSIYKFPSADKFSERLNTKVNREGDSFTYEYRISNSKNSDQKIWSFWILKYAEILDKKAPKGWKVILSENPEPERIAWWATDSTQQIVPGDSRHNISVISEGLPAIIKYYTEGWVPPPHLEETPDSVENSSIFKNSKTGYVVGPKTIPINHSAIADSLNSYLDFSCDTGWIKNKGVCQRLRTQVNKIQREMERGQDKAVANSIKALLNELSALKEKKISSEAYALLYYNSEFLLERLGN